MFTFQLIWKRVKKSGHQVAYDQDDSLNALVRRLSALPFTKHEDMDEAFALFKLRADKLEPKLKEFCHELISYSYMIKQITIQTICGSIFHTIKTLSEIGV